MPRPNRALLLADAADQLRDVTTTLSLLETDARDRHSDAASLSIVSKQFALAVQSFCEEMSLHSCNVFGIDPEEEVFGVTRMIKPNAPNETPEDLAHWLNGIAVDRSYGSLRTPSPISYAAE